VPFIYHSRAVVRLATELYLSYWDRAIDPFRGRAQAAAGGVSGQEAEFLRLLVHGASADCGEVE
jgi:hypothetical protein